MKYYETEKIELKERISDSLVKDIEAFLNTEGGTIYIGVKDDGSPIGIENLDEAYRKISDILSDQIEPSVFDVVYSRVIYGHAPDSKGIIELTVPKGPDCLYCIKKYGRSSNGCHVRVGTTCKSMTTEMIDKRYERKLLSSDLLLKKTSLMGNLQFTKLKLLLTENGYHLDDKTFAENLKLRNEEGKYNYLAELLADNNSTSFIFAKFKGTTKADYSERSDYGNQCLVIAYEMMKNRLLSEDICKTITDVRPRKDIYLYDMNAVNEALLNAVVHNDYRITEPQVTYFSDRLEIVSHGGLPAGFSRTRFFSGESLPRNSQLMEIFVMLGYVEHTGHGIPMIVDKYGKDVFVITDDMIKVIIPFDKTVMENHGFSDSYVNKEENDESPVLKNVEEVNGTDEKENRILESLKSHPDFSAKELSEDTSIPFRSVQRYIASLRDRGLIRRRGSRKTGFWEIIDEKDRY